MKLSFIDDFLNGTTMYRLMLYYLFVLIVLSLIFSTTGHLSFKPADYLVSFAILNIACWGINKIISLIAKAPVNEESSFITAVILSLIIYPPSLSEYPTWTPLYMLLATSAIAMASKYLLAYRYKHVFNPAALAVTVGVFVPFIYPASWWAGNIYLLPAIILGGLLVVKKLQRWQMVGAFFLSVIITTAVNASVHGTTLPAAFESMAFYSPVFFFAFVMFTEPLTGPLKESYRIIYALLIGFLFAWPIQVGNWYILPEMALLVGNIFAFAVSPKGRYLLTLVSKREIGTNMQEFVFNSYPSVPYQAGQYMEWTIGKSLPDLRGNRRYFTISSSPTEKQIMLATKFYENPSTYKTDLMNMKPGDKMSASHQSGDFVLPQDKTQKLGFIAGGIGVAPFRSMVKYLIDNNEQRDIVLFYSCKTKEEAAYSELFDSAKLVGVKTVFVFSNAGEQLSAEKIKESAPDYLERMFYISGPHAMVNTFEQSLKESGVVSKNIKIDFFPGYV